MVFCNGFLLSEWENIYVYVWLFLCGIKIGVIFYVC